MKLSRLPQASRTGDRIPFQRPPLRAILYNLNIFFFFFPVGIILKLIFILHMLNSCIHVLNMSTLQRLEFKTHYAKKSRWEVLLWSLGWRKRRDRTCFLQNTVFVGCGALLIFQTPLLCSRQLFAKKAAKTNTKVLNIKFCTATISISFRFLITKKKVTTE